MGTGPAVLCFNTRPFFLNCLHGAAQWSSRVNCSGRLRRNASRARGSRNSGIGWPSKRGLTFADFEALWRWSTTDIDAFWQACWDFFGIEATQPATAVLGKRTMPGAEWFPGAELNYARHMLRHERPDATAVLHLNERQGLQAVSWEELAGKVRIVATQLRKLGVKKGDRVCAYVVNVPEALIAMLATTSLGAIWSSVGPDFGTPGVLDRFSQLDAHGVHPCGWLPVRRQAV